MNFFNKLSIVKKLILAATISSVSLLVVGFINFSTLQTVLKFYHHITDINMPNTQVLSVMRQHAGIIGVHLNESYIQFTHSNFEGEEFGEIANEVKAYTDADKIYNDIPFAPGEAEIYNPANEQWIKNQKALKEVEALYWTKDLSKSDILLKKIETLTIDIETHVAKLEKLDEFHQKQAKNWTASAFEAASTGQILSISAIAFFFLLSQALGLWIATTLSRRLRSVADELKMGAADVTDASNGLASTAQELSQATTEQAASLEQTAASIEEMASMVAKNSDNSVGTATLASQSQASAVRGEEVVRTMISSMDDINRSNANIMDAISQSNREISDIIKVITEIGNKTKVINDIVFQTKLLSFNASVEAARAGEHGKGFAVVAEEVGNLAQMSGNAAKEISSMLEGSIQKVEGIVQDTQKRVERLIEDGKHKVEQGTGVARECGRVLHEIVSNIEKVTLMAQEISAASNEQSKGVSEISKAMNQLDHVTQQNAQTSDMTASSSEQLSTQAANLRSVVGKLMREVEGDNGSDQYGVHQKDYQDQKSFKSEMRKNKNNVVPLKAKLGSKASKSFSNGKNSSSLSSQGSAKLMAANGATATTPSFDDSRFEDV